MRQAGARRLYRDLLVYDEGHCRAVTIGRILRLPGNRDDVGARWGRLAASTTPAAPAVADAAARREEHEQDRNDNPSDPQLYGIPSHPANSESQARQQQPSRVEKLPSAGAPLRRS